MLLYKFLYNTYYVKCQLTGKYLPSKYIIQVHLSSDMFIFPANMMLQKEKEKTKKTVSSCRNFGIEMVSVEHGLDGQ